MKIVIPMAGMGKRMRPHTLITPKPLLAVAGKPIVERLVETIAELVDEKIEEICFVIGDFGPQVKENLKNIASRLGAKGSIYHQKEALGTAHAIHCAKESLSGPTIVAFADTLFDANFTLDTSADSVIWVKQIDDPSAFGVVTTDNNQNITAFVEKPTEFVSDLAIIGVYYFKDGANLKAEIQHLIDQNIMKSGEYQLTDVLENMRQKGKVLKPGKVNRWLDFGNKNVFVQSVSELLDYKGLSSEQYKTENSKIIEPCFIGEGVELYNSTIGPYVSIEKNTIIKDSHISKSVVMAQTEISNAKFENSMIGNHTTIKENNTLKEVSIGDFNTVITHEH